MKKLEQKLGGDPLKIEPPKGNARRTFDRLAERHAAYRAKLVRHAEERLRRKLSKRPWPIPRIDIEPISLGDRGHRYRVIYAGGVLIGHTRNPEYDACRALLAMSITGRLEIWRTGAPFPASAIDIERGARWTILETERESPRIARWRPLVAGTVQDAVSARAGSSPAAISEMAASNLA